MDNFLASDIDISFKSNTTIFYITVVYWFIVFNYDQRMYYSNLLTSNTFVVLIFFLKY